MLLLSLPYMRETIAEQKVEPWRRSINRIQRKTEIIGNILKDFFTVIMFTAVLNVIFLLMNDSVIQLLLEWCKGTFIVAFLPIIVSWIQQNKNKCGIQWSMLNVLLGAIITIIGYAVNSTDTVNKYKQVIIISYSLFVSILLISLWKIYRDEKVGYGIKKVGKGIRKDLYYRTTNLDLNFSQIELIRHCERFFYDYIFYLKKMKNIEAIEYVTLMGIYKDEWYKRAAKIMKKFILVCVVFILVSLFHDGPSLKMIIVFTIMIVFGININILKKIDIDYLDKIAIRYFFDEWGYGISFNKGKYKFAGNVQMLDFGIHHNFIHALLDIVALCRAISLYDETSNTNKISLLSKNFRIR